MPNNFLGSVNDNNTWWTFLGEVQVLDSAVPEPATGTLAAMAIGSILIRRGLIRE